MEIKCEECLFNEFNEDFNGGCSLCILNSQFIPADHGMLWAFLKKTRESRNEITDLEREKEERLAEIDNLETHNTKLQSDNSELLRKIRELKNALKALSDKAQKTYADL